MSSIILPNDTEDDVKRKSIYRDGTMYNVIEQDETGYVDENTRIRNEKERASRIYSGKQILHRAMNVPMVGIEKLMRGQCCTDAKVNKKRYNLLSTDPEERRRAIIHIQNYHKEYMVVPGNPFGRK